MSKYFGILIHLLEPLGFRLRYSSFLLSKFASHLKLIQSVVPVGILGVCVKSSILRILLSGFWVSGSQVPSSRVPIRESHVPGSCVPGSQSPRIWVPGLQTPGPRYQGPRSQVLILDYAVMITYAYIRFHV